MYASPHKTHMHVMGNFTRVPKPWRMDPVLSYTAGTITGTPPDPVLNTPPVRVTGSTKKTQRGSRLPALLIVGIPLPPKRTSGIPRGPWAAAMAKDPGLHREKDTTIYMHTYIYIFLYLDTRTYFMYVYICIYFYVHIDIYISIYIYRNVA